MIEFVARDSTIPNITCWKDALVQRYLVVRSQSTILNSILNLNSRIKMACQKIKLKKNWPCGQAPKKNVNFTVKVSYKDDKKYINLVSFEWV